MSKDDYRCEAHGQQIRLLKDGETVWGISLRDLRFIGEETSGSGPYLDDHFLVLVDAFGNWYRLSLDMANINETLTALEKHANTKIEFLLANKVGDENRILWPEEYRGKRMFAYSRESKPGFSGWLRKQLGLERVSVSLDPEVLQAISGVHEVGDLPSLDDAIE